MQFSLSETRLVSSAQKNVTFSTTDVIVTFDNHDVIFVRDLNVQLQDMNEKVVIERQEIKELSLTSNKVTAVSMSQFKVVFPYQYAFGECWKEVSVHTVNEPSLR